jgi:hypothetical protein
VLRRTAGPPDRLVGVKIGSLGPRVQVDYTTLADRDVHFPGRCSYPQVCLTRDGSIVAEHRLTTGQPGGWNRFRHLYFEARADVSGGGWLGFAKHWVEDLQTGSDTVTEFDNVTRSTAGGVAVFARANLPEKTTFTVDIDMDPHIRRTYRLIVTNSYDVVTSGAGRYVVQLRQRVENETEQPAPPPMRLRTTTITYDEFGNPRRVVTAVANGRTVTEQSFYTNDQANWLIGQLNRQVTTACTAANAACTTRENTFGYYPNGNLRQVVAQPSQPVRPDLWLSTVIEYDAVGNVVTVAASDADGNARTNRWEYDGGDGLHPTSTTNALGHTSTYLVHSGLGVTLRVTGPNPGQVATMRHDWFGRPRETTRSDGSFERVDYKSGDVGPFAIETASSNAPTTLVELDNLGREKVSRVRAFAGGWSSTYTTYDALGRVATMSMPVPEGGTPVRSA